MEKNYVKAVLYIYPRLERLAKDYGEHIERRALCSYRREGAEKEAEYLAGEVLKKRAAEGLKERVEGVIGKLGEEERFLLELRYFGRRKTAGSGEEKKRWSERSYYRRQEKLLEKVEALFAASGMTEEWFFREFGGFGWMMAVCRKVGKGEACAAGASEKKWLAERKRARSSAPEKNFAKTSAAVRPSVRTFV